jgi:hypothetical protein
MTIHRGNIDCKGEPRFFFLSNFAIRKIGCVVTFSIMASGCANIMTIDRSKSLPDNGKAIHLDTQQRLVYAKAGHLCAEPSPDAVQSVSSSFGGGVAAPREGSSAIANALQQSVGSIGLRTQSITLMRDQLYRVCEAAYNKSLTPLDVVQLLERSQDLTLAVLSIEQLTGAVAAKQITITGGAHSTSSAEISNTQAALDHAKEIEAEKKKTLEDATTKLTKDNDALKVAKAIAPATAESTAQIASLEPEITKDTDVQTAAQKSYDDAQKATGAIEKNFNAALVNADAAVSSTANFSEVRTNSSTIDKDTAEKVSTAVTAIVQAVINKGHITDSCLNYLTSPNPTAPNALSTQMIAFCVQAIRYDQQIIAQHGSNGPPEPDHGKGPDGRPPAVPPKGAAPADTIPQRLPPPLL